MIPLKNHELVNHPAFKDAILPLVAHSKGKIAVAKDRGGPISIAYEIHGRGPVKLVWIMGLGMFRTGWQWQTAYFGHERGDMYSSLILDNRGMGESDIPFTWYSTSEMARDIIDILDTLDWTADRQLHIVGASMGGMIAQELAFLEPKRVASLTLFSTAAQMVNTKGFIENLKEKLSLFVPRGIDGKIAIEKQTLFAEKWILAPDEEGVWPTNGDRFASEGLHKMDDPGYTMRGFYLQLLAVSSHSKSPQHLAKVADDVGRERIQVIGGKLDQVMTLPLLERLVRDLGGSERGITKTVRDDVGHMMQLEGKAYFNSLIETSVTRTESTRS